MSGPAMEGPGIDLANGPRKRTLTPKLLKEGSPAALAASEQRYSVSLEI